MDNEIVAESVEPPSTEEPPGSQWNNWHWQFKNRLQTPEDLKKIAPLASQEATSIFPFAITPYYLSLIKKFDNSDPIFRMAMPQKEELGDGLNDPLCEDSMSPVPGLVHRYKDRALVISTSICAMYCRYCTRKRRVGIKEHVLNTEELVNIVKYLKNHPEVSDVIISGGDPFTFETPRLEKIVSAIRSVPTVDIIRIGTKVPVTMPMRVDYVLTEMLKKYQPIFVSTHFNHPQEITGYSQEACSRLIDAGIPMLNQSVLLRGVNDDKLIIEKLCRTLVKMRVRPYYLFQCDLVTGTEHFRTKVSKGIEIMEHLRGRLSGMAIPQYVIDAPGGKGKIPVSPTYLISQTPEKTVLRNYQFEMVEYPN